MVKFFKVHPLEEFKRLWILADEQHKLAQSTQTEGVNADRMRKAVANKGRDTATQFIAAYMLGTISLKEPDRRFDYPTDEQVEKFVNSLPANISQHYDPGELILRILEE